MDFDWRSIVKTVAPTIASAFGGPLAGMAVRAASEALLGKSDGTEADIAAAIQGATPDQLLALKKADHDFAVSMKQLDVDLERVNQGDRASARDREVQLKSRAPAVLAALTIVGFFGTLAALITGEAIVPKEYEMLVGGLIGALGASMTQVYNYYFGSSAGSVAKDATFHKMLSKN